MVRDWKIIKELLNELQPLHQFNGLHLMVYYGGEHVSPEKDIHKMEMARLLIEKKYITGIVSKTIAPGGFAEISNMTLTFEGHDLLDKLNDDTLWNRIIGLAKEKSIKLTFATLDTLTKKALDEILQSIS